MSKDIYCQCLFFSSNALTRKLTRMAEDVFHPIGLAPSYAFILMTINKQPGISAGEIATIMQLQPSTVTRLIDRLEKEKYVIRKTQGKFSMVFPLIKAQRLDQSLKTAWMSLYKNYSDILGEEAAKTLTASIYEASNKL